MALDSPNSSVVPALSLRNVSKNFGGVQALDNVSFQVMPGEVHCLAGENGCGKSTLIKIITGVYTPEAGVGMSFFGWPVSSVTPNEARKLGIAVIWQDLALFSEMSVAENIAFETLLGNSPKLVNYHRLRRLSAEALTSLGEDIDPDAPLRSLPIAKRQIVAIARALVGNARLIFMDEPTASLTQSETGNLLGLVRKLSRRGVSVVFVSHRLAEVLEIADRVTVLRDGSLVGAFEAQGMTQSRLTELMTGQTFDAEVSARDRSAVRKVIKVRGLARVGEYRDIDLTIHEGEIVGLTGLIGAGRTELGHTLFGMTQPDSGTISLDGKPLKLRSNRDAVNAGIAYVSEDRLSLGLVQAQPISGNVVMSILPRISSRFGMISRHRKDDQVTHWIDQLAVKIGQPTDAVATLSGGNQQRVVLAKWLATNPRVLILDSPTVGVDVGARAGIFRIIRQLAESGLAILMISDEVPEVYVNADRILHMASGRIIGEYDPRTVTLPELEQVVYD